MNEIVRDSEELPQRGLFCLYKYCDIIITVDEGRVRAILGSELIISLLGV